MKNLAKIVFLVIVLTNMNLFSQKSQRDLDNYRNPDKRGINVFEAPKDTATTFDQVKVRIGGAFALQYQALDHENNADPVLNTNGVNTNQLANLGNNFNLATANLDIDVVVNVQGDEPFVKKEPLQKLLEVSRNNEERKMFVHVSDSHFEIIILQNQKLQLFNTFDYKTPEDFIYYILFTAEQLHLNPEHFKLELLGKITDFIWFKPLTYGKCPLIAT